jgi:hypothetical protein
MVNPDGMTISGFPSPVVGNLDRPARVLTADRDLDFRQELRPR